MGFKAKGEGHVTFTKSVEDVRTQYSNIFKVLYENWFPLRDFYKPDVNTIYLSAEPTWNYDDGFVPLLDKLSSVTEDGLIEYVGDDDSTWCFKFNPDKKKWEVHDGYIVYDDELEMSRTIKNAFLAYVENDYAAATDSFYIRSVLTDVCGLDEASIKRCGLDWLFAD